MNKLHRLYVAELKFLDQCLLVYLHNWWRTFAGVCVCQTQNHLLKKMQTGCFFPPSSGLMLSHQRCLALNCLSWDIFVLLMAGNHFQTALGTASVCSCTHSTAEQWYHRYNRSNERCFCFFVWVKTVCFNSLDTTVKC